MARVESVKLLDDLDGGAADETVSFALDGKSFEIDLSEANAGKLREVLAPFVQSARRAGTAARSSRSSNRRPSASHEHNQRVREWARAQGMEINERGRIPANVLAAYAEQN
jgi:hypothetical protein